MKIRSDDDIRTDRSDLQSRRPILILTPLNTELNPICHLLALLGTHHILHVSRIRVKVGEKMIESTAETGKSILYKNCHLLFMVFFCCNTIKLFQNDIGSSPDAT